MPVPRRVPLGFSDRDPRRARLHADVRDAVNAMVGTTVTVTTPVVANQEFGVRHANLGHRAEQFQIVSQDKPGHLYASSRQKWTNTATFFKYDQAGGGRIVVRLS